MSSDAAMEDVDAAGVQDAGPGPTTAAATPSAGCSAGTGRPAGGTVVVSGSHYFSFPADYDGTKPYPVLMGFHGCGGGNRGTSIDDTEWTRITRGTAFESDYVRVVPLSSNANGCWSYGTDIGRVTAVYDELLANHCVDTRRVFATGHSSGAQLVVQIVTQQHTGDAQHLSFRALAPIAASDYGAIAGPVPVMYIQGQMDKERGNGDGHETVEQFRAANGCSQTSMAYSQVAGCQSGATTVNPGCIVYASCQAPTVWCSHDDPAYGGTMHGVPCFAMTAMHDFFGTFE
jgi:poly(3-hydroxybutyrate) depolymerase